MTDAPKNTDDENVMSMIKMSVEEGIEQEVGMMF